MELAKAESRPREIKYEISVAAWIPGVKLPFRLRVTTGDVRLLIRRVRQFRKLIWNSGTQDKKN